MLSLDDSVCTHFPVTISVYRHPAQGKNSLKKFTI